MPLIQPMTAQMSSGSVPIGLLFFAMLLGFLLICLFIGVILWIAQMGKKHRSGAWGAIACISILALLCFITLVGGYSSTEQRPAVVAAVPFPVNPPDVQFGGNARLPAAPPKPFPASTAVAPSTDGVSTENPFSLGTKEGPRLPIANELLSNGELSPTETLEPMGLQVEPIRGATVTAWSESDVNEFSASVYPDLVDCAEPLARQLREILSDCKPESNADEAEGKNATFVCDLSADPSLGELSTNFLDRFTTQLRKDHPEVQFQFHHDSIEDTLESDSPSDETNSDQTCHARLNISTELDSPSPSLPWNNELSAQQGKVICRLQNDDASVSFETRFLNKPWVFHFDRFVSEHPGRHYVVGYSQKLASSEGDARRMAMDSAQSQVRIAAGRGVPLTISDRHVVDRFAQKLSRPYGDVWRQAVLVDVSGDAMQRTASVAVRRRDQHQEQESRVLFVFALFVGLTIAVCLIANALTQGYYRNHLGVGAGGLVVLIITTLLLFIS